jgi:hypothetical protein
MQPNLWRCSVLIINLKEWAQNLWSEQTNGVFLLDWLNRAHLASQDQALFRIFTGEFLCQTLRTQHLLS